MRGSSCRGPRCPSAPGAPQAGRSSGGAFPDNHRRLDGVSPSNPPSPAEGQRPHPSAAGCRHPREREAGAPDEGARPAPRGRGHRDHRPHRPRSDRGRGPGGERRARGGQRRPVGDGPIPECGAAAARARRSAPDRRAGSPAVRGASRGRSADDRRRGGSPQRHRARRGAGPRRLRARRGAVRPAPTRRRRSGGLRREHDDPSPRGGRAAGRGDGAAPGGDLVP